MSPEVGKTKDTGWQIGVRRTLDIGFEDAWRLVFSSSVIAVWLGGDPSLEWFEGEPYELADGTRGEVRVAKPGSHVRVTRWPPGAERWSIVQVRIIERGDRTLVAFMEQHLPGPEARRERREVFLRALDDLATVAG